MGHDITAYLASDYAGEPVTEDDDEDRWEAWYTDLEEKKLAHLRRNAFDPMNRMIYLALGADQHYNGISGGGGKEVFSPEKISSALTLLQQRDAAELLSTERHETQEKFLGLFSSLFAGLDTEIGQGQVSLEPEIEFLRAVLEKCGGQPVVIEFS